MSIDPDYNAAPSPAPTGEIDPDNPWGTFLDVKFGPLEPFDINELVRANRRPWFNQSLTRINDCVVRLGVLHGIFPWHVHEDEDEFFYVIDGQMAMDLEDGRTVQLAKGQGIAVPMGSRHRPRAPERTVILMVEGAGVIPLGDGGATV